MSTRRSSMRTQRTFGGDTKRKLLQGHDKKLIRNRIRVYHLVDLWTSHAPLQLQKSIMNWKQKEKGNSAFSTAATPKILNHVT